MTQAVSPTVYTVPEAAATLRISKHTIYKLIRSRELESIQIRRRRLVPVAAVQDYISRLGDESLA
ncbi:helix-turn-helix domain-containing protein [Actinokineospora guangxiensis]|uniref:Helix-turn-helix domain-containing protein n=1 Tax=Actinokineospora guangxiensis TaxID=1490288 RepID=A0ABW0ESY1_9PSEU